MRWIPGKINYSSKAPVREAELTDRHCGLGMRRLNIIDLEGGLKGFTLDTNRRRAHKEPRVPRLHFRQETSEGALRGAPRQYQKTDLSGSIVSVAGRVPVKCR